MAVKRTVKNGRVTVQGRTYYVCAFQRAKLEGQVVYVDDDGVCRLDSPKDGIYTERAITCFYPRRYDYAATLHLDQGFADQL